MSVYKIIRVIGSSPTSWEEAAKNAVEEAGKHLRDMRIAEVEQFDLRLENGKVVEYRAPCTPVIPLRGRCLASRKSAYARRTGHCNSPARCGVRGLCACEVGLFDISDGCRTPIRGPAPPLATGDAAKAARHIA